MRRSSSELPVVAGCDRPGVFDQTSGGSSMKIVLNENEAACLVCFFCTGVTIKGGVAVCKRCGHSDLIDMRGNIFEPIFGTDPQATFQASRYTPPVPERRKNKRSWPKHKERRKESSMLFV